MAFMALLLLVIFIVIMLTGIPVGYGMGALTVISFLLLGGDLSMIPQKLFSGIDTYICMHSSFYSFRRYHDSRWNHKGDCYVL